MHTKNLAVLKRQVRVGNVDEKFTLFCLSLSYLMRNYLFLFAVDSEEDGGECQGKHKAES